MKGATCYSTSLAFFDEKVEVLETFAARVKIFVKLKYSKQNVDCISREIGAVSSIPPQIDLDFVR